MADEIAQKNKDKFYRGKKVDELVSLDTREFAKLVKSRPRRAIMRNYDVIEQFVNKCKERVQKNRPIRTHSRELVIVPAMLGKTIWVHNGKEFMRVEINEEMLGHRLGEFALTRRTTKHGAAGVGATKSSASRSVK
ncbi:MAG: ribosomal protein S19 family protein [Candidatus Pacearchaeota archaeon]